jgi:hypothetical protein
VGETHKRAACKTVPLTRKHRRWSEVDPICETTDVGTKVESRLPLAFFFVFENPLSRFLLLFLLYCGYVGNAFALSKRSGISTGLAAASILSMPARHTAIGIWLFIA